MTQVTVSKKLGETDLNRKVIAADLFLEICSKTKMEVRFRQDRVSYTGTPSQVAKANAIVTKFEKDHSVKFITGD